MEIEVLRGNLLEVIRKSNDVDLLLDLNSRVEVDELLDSDSVGKILGGVDYDELSAQVNEPNTPENSVNEEDFIKWLNKWKSS